MFSQDFRDLLINPSQYQYQRTYSFQACLQRYLRQTPIAPLMDVVTALITAVSLIYKGLPVQTALGSFPHLLCRRNEDYRDKLHDQDKMARIHLFFSALWTTTLVLNINLPWFWNDLIFWMNVVSLIPILAPGLRKSPRLCEHRIRAHLDDFNKTLEQHGIEPGVVSKVYHWAGNVAIWTHRGLFLYSFTYLIKSIVLLRSPLRITWLYVRSYTNISVQVAVAFILVGILAIAIFKVVDVFSPYSAWGRNPDAIAKRFIFIGAVSSIAYGYLMKVLLTDHFSISVWMVSDWMFWAASEGLLGYSIVMSTDSFGDYMHSKRFEEDVMKRAEKEVKWAQERKEEEDVAREWLQEAMDAESEDSISSKIEHREECSTNA